MKYEDNIGKYIKLPNPGLRSYLGKVEYGQPDEYRTTFFKGKHTNEVLAKWDEQLSVINSEWPTLYEFEVDLGKKVGPMSIMKPLRERMDDIESYYDSILRNQVPISEQGMNRTLTEWKQIANLHLRSQSRVVDLMKKSTNSGTPYFTKRRSVVKTSFPVTVKVEDDGQYLLQSAEQFYAAAIIGWRGQEGGPRSDDVKQRVVWMFPFSVNILEMQLYQPLIEASQKFNLVPAWVSMESVYSEITHMFDSKGKDDLVICTDFSKFDQHFNESCQTAAFLMLKELMTSSTDSTRWLTDVFPIKYNIPLIIGNRKIITGKHGMASGSGGTNADETLVHRALQHEAAYKAGKTLNPHSQCLGDDGVLTYPGCTVDDVIGAYTSHGLEMNPDKQYTSTQDCTYLRRWFHTDYRISEVCVGVYSTNRALGRLCQQERYYDPKVWDREMVALRQLSIIENCKYHPLFEEFVDYCMKGDIYRLGLDIPGFLADIGAIGKRAIENIPDLVGYVKSMQSESDDFGIESWRVVQYLKSKA